MSEDTYRTIWEHYLQGATPTQTWHSLLDDHVDWIPLTTVTKLFLRFSEESNEAEPHEHEWPGGQRRSADPDQG
jgi:hypothetical protein